MQTQFNINPAEFLLADGYDAFFTSTPYLTGKKNTQYPTRCGKSCKNLLALLNYMNNKNIIYLGVNFTPLNIVDNIFNTYLYGRNHLWHYKILFYRQLP